MRRRIDLAWEGQTTPRCRASVAVPSPLVSAHPVRAPFAFCTQTTSAAPSLLLPCFVRALSRGASPSLRASPPVAPVPPPFHMCTEQVAHVPPISALPPPCFRSGPPPLLCADGHANWGHK